MANEQNAIFEKIMTCLQDLTARMTAMENSDRPGVSSQEGLGGDGLEDNLDDVADQRESRAHARKIIAQLLEAQAKADAVYSANSLAAPRPMDGEGLLAYRRRLLRPLQSSSTEWANHDLSRMDSAVLDVAERQIYADAMTAARSPVGLPNGALREIITTDSTGRRISSFVGNSPKAWLDDVLGNRPRRVANFNTKFD